MKKGLVIVLSALVLASCGRPQRTVSPKSSDTSRPVLRKRNSLVWT